MTIPFSPITPHPYSGLNYGHGLYGVDSIGTVDPSSVTDDTVCPAGDSGVLDEIFCQMKRFFGNLLRPRGMIVHG